jgi:hypothetical protein
VKHRFLSRPKPLSMLVQAAALQKHRDTISVFTRGSSLLKWRGRVIPAAYCETYTIDLEYRRDTRFVPRPRVIVLNPPLQLREGKACPHRHSDQEPCLYYHHGNEWHSGMLIAHTIIPWASRWLYYYEIWLATGEWMGGGIHPLSVLKARQEIENRDENRGRV